jgi:hypothetical protein
MYHLYHTSEFLSAEIVSFFGCFLSNSQGIVSDAYKSFDFPFVQVDEFEALASLSCTVAK